MPIDLRLDPAEIALLTDLYELTVGAAFFEHGFNEVAPFVTGISTPVRERPCSERYC